MPATESLSIQQARKLVLLSQRLPPVKQKGSAKEATLEAIEHLGYIQIDTISVIQRAHHHTLWSRNPRYKSSQLEALLAEKHVFEYWSHAAAYLPMKDYRYSLPRKNALASGKQSHWFKRDEGMMKKVLDRIKEEGPLMAKDFEHKGKKIKEWGSKPAKQALETLFMEGKLMIPYRVNFHKVYELTERVLPTGLDTSEPTPKEHTRFLITRFLQANGMGQASEIAYLLKNTKPLVSETLQEMHENGELVEVNAESSNYFALPATLELLNKPLSRTKLNILSPFDNLLIQRKRMAAFFDFDYQIECYMPEPKRKFGYFSLPILWDGKLVARMDCKADRKTSIFHINHLALEPSLRKKEQFAVAFSKELPSFVEFNGCNNLLLHKTSPASFKSELDYRIF
ncbi:crosslink repair DNA glycosylase YcaQ family protein [Flammeovirgaceae bacterium SG7u.111]|nr:crosslink repair DNA glycosylase YcaQ family protein [Flammeovirgaceae bacterium SG7u.132]WPO38165.1 crosslink repair DNA glycosylase YcaQ family protein [Flammeovirgaceae bacterium SG7u.111]